MRRDDLLVRGSDGEQTFSTDVRVIFGRGADCQVRLNHPAASREHATVTFEAGWTLSDSGSTNGVFVDGRRLTAPMPIDRPIKIRFGNDRDSPEFVVSVRTPRPTPSGGSATIGRSRDCTVFVDDLLVSREHARVTTEAGRHTIEDLGSANGTFVNGRRIRKTLLEDRDVVTVGNSDLEFVDGELRSLPAPDSALRIADVAFAVGPLQILKNVDLVAERGSLTALIGPSGAGKSSLAKVVAGTYRPTAGTVLFQGHDLHAEYESLRSRIGIVPQDDVLHVQLTVREVLDYAAELRLPEDLPRDARDARVLDVMDELMLSEHSGTRVDRLSGGQRKRVSVALELLTGPMLLILDEPTSGLDPAMDRQVMQMLRRLADAGRVVIVVTHTVTQLSECDQLLVLAGGMTAYNGPTDQFGAAFGMTDWADIYKEIFTNPEKAHAAHLARTPRARNRPARLPHGPVGQPTRASAGRQARTLIRRQVRLILADQGYLAVLLALPLLLGALSLVVPGSAGFGSTGEDAPTEATQLLVMLILGACLSGLALSVRDLVGERRIYLRERAAGLLTPAYLLSKALVFCAVATAQSAVIVAIVTWWKGHPQSGVIMPNGTAELFVVTSFTACSCVLLGLVLSSVARSGDQVMPLLAVAVMAQLVMSGGLIPVTDRPGIDQLSWLFPARWGFASAASTVDLRARVPGAQADALWNHQPAIWFANCTLLAALAATYGLVAWWRLERTEP